MKTIFVSKVPFNLFGFILLIISLFIVCVILIVSVYSLISFFSDFTIGFIFFALFWFYFLVYANVYYLDCIIWNCNGKEEIVMSENDLIIRKRGKMLKTKHVIPLSEIQSVVVRYYEKEHFLFSPLQTANRYSRAIGEIGGKILIKYGKQGKRKVDFGLGITDEQAKQYVQEITLLARPRGSATRV